MLKVETVRDKSTDGLETPVDSTIISLAANRNVYIVSVAGAAGMTVQEVADALRAAMVHYVRAASGKVPEGFGAREPRPGEVAPNETDRIN